MNTKLVESIYQVIQSLSEKERLLLEQKLFLDLSYPSQTEIVSLADTSKAFKFLHNEPDLYAMEDGEAI